ncbi:hypothetical protein CEXT_585801 [Caerostris extrusa]|uniref:Uncharacterized protein n=1 Tax=Caerostris extrusa TaxID=172846 RepID=A0AAV4WG99_CAEEX|nr:hypothetical protein CEXT_585801 [Caerostris extrusa]
MIVERQTKPNLRSFSPSKPLSIAIQWIPGSVFMPMVLPWSTLLQEPFFAVRIFEGFRAACLNDTNFEVEIEAVRRATFYLSDTNIAYRHAAFLVDSQSAILTLRSTRTFFAAKFRIVCEHGYLEEHLHRISLKVTPDCPLLFR